MFRAVRNFTHHPYVVTSVRYGKFAIGSAIAASCTIRYSLFIFFSIFASLISTCISASQTQTTQLELSALSSEEQSIIKKITSYLYQNSLSPFFKKGTIEYKHLYFLKDSSKKNTHALGMITQGNNSCFSLFSISKTWFWNEIQTDLVYLTTDTPHSPLLFADIVYLASNSLAYDLSNFHILIEKKADSTLPKGSKRQKWTFFNQQETAELFVILTEDGQGGTYFSIELPNF